MNYHKKTVADVDVRGKYGPGAISSAGLLQNDLGISPVGEKLPPPEGK